MQNNTPTTLNNQRHGWIDGAKTIGILLVVLGHMSLAEYIVTPIFSFHMALFFFISGFLEKNKQIKETFKNGIKGLIIPYTFFYVLSYFWWFHVSLLRHPEIYGNVSLDSALIKPIFGLFFGVGYCTEHSTMINVPLWFFIGLFVVKLLHCLLLIICKENKIKYTLMCFSAVLIAIILKKTKIDLFISIDSALLAFPFFSLGYLFQKGNIDIINKFLFFFTKKSFLIKSILIILTMVTLLLLSNFNGRVDINEFNFGKNILIFYTNGFLGIIFIICIASFYKKPLKNITTISNGTIIIVAFHVYLFEILFKIIGKKGEGIIINPILAITIGIITLALMIKPIRIFEKYFPTLIGKTFRRN